jgi:hypothetical protein
MRHLLPMLSVPLHQLELVPDVKPCPLMFILLEMIMRSSTASGSTRLQALHLLTCLTHPSVYPPATVAAQSWGATLPLLGAVVTSSKVFKTTNWGFTSLAVATKLMVMLAYQVAGLAEGGDDAVDRVGAKGSAINAVSAAALHDENARAMAGSKGLAGQGSSSREDGAQSSETAEKLSTRGSNSSNNDSGGHSCWSKGEAEKHSPQGRDCCRSRCSDQGMLPIGHLSRSSSSIKDEQHRHNSSVNLDKGLAPTAKGCPGSSSGLDGGTDASTSSRSSSSKCPCTSPECTDCTSPPAAP